MTWFLLKGLMRDRNRSLFPLLTVGGGTLVTVLLYCLMMGTMEDITATNARLDTGHVKIMTRGYAEIMSQMPNDLALPGIKDFLIELRRDYPALDWVARIKFGGLLDFPNEQGETRAQGPVFGIALDLLSETSHEKERLNLESALVRGRLPRTAGEIVVSDTLARNLGAEIGDVATLISSTANGSMAIQNFVLVGTLRFGIGVMDRNAMLADLSDIQYALDMEDSAGEILGYFRDGTYHEREADRLAKEFNARFQEVQDEWAPVMRTLRDQNGLGEYLDIAHSRIFVIILGFIFVMSMVLWNAGLMSGLRRYGEIGVRLAFGESKGHVYRTLIYESVLIGLIGSTVGTAIGLGISYYLQVKGLDLSSMMKGSAILWPSVMRARITAASFTIGFIPGLAATILGTMASGIGIFKRQTSQLFKELEV